MVRLVVNDIRLNSDWLFLLFLLLNIMIAGAMTPYPYHYSGMRAGLSFTMLMPLVVVLREEYYRGHQVLHSLPIGNERLIYARYISVVLLAIAPALYGWLYQALIEYLGPHGPLSYYAQQLESGYSVEHSLIASSIGWSALLALGMPLVVMFGSFWRVLVAFLALQVVWGRVLDYLLALSLRTSSFLGMSRWMFFVTVFIIAITAISVRLSVWLEGQREL